MGAQTYNQIYANYAITTSDTLVVSSEKIILNNGDALYANSNASPSLTATVGYISLYWHVYLKMQVCKQEVLQLDCRLVQLVIAHPYL